MPRHFSGLLVLGWVAVGCGGDRAPAGATAPAAPVSVTDEGGLTVTAEDGRVRLRSVPGRTTIAGVPYGSFGFSTAPEPELVPPSFETLDAVPEPGEGARHVATKLLSRTETADGFVATLATDDPAGRTLTVAVRDAPGALPSIDVVVSDPEGVTAVFAAFSCAADEAFHGFGGRRESTNLRGASFSNWVFDYRFPTPETAYYYPVPAFESSAGYVFYVETDENVRFRMGSDVPTAFRVAVNGDRARFVVVPDGGSSGLAALTARIGRERKPPDWSLGATLSRTIQLFVDAPAVYQKKVEDDVRKLQSGAYPVTAYAYEGWARLPADFVKATNATLRGLSVHPMLYFRPFVSDDAAATEPLGRFAEATAAGYVAKTATGDPYVFPSPFDGKDAALVDFTNDAAREWWKGIVKDALDLGADGFMNDFGEQVLPDMVFSDGSTGVTLHNRYPVLEHRTAREALDEYVAEHPDREPFFFVRGGYSGTPGATAYENAEFPGDETCDYSKRTGLPSIVPDLLNRSILGGYGFDTDIGGYADFDGRGPDAELYSRWSEAAALLPFFRVHNSALTGVKMPWSYDDATEKTWIAMAKLHERARPLLLSLWDQALAGGAPPIRPLWLDADGGSPPHVDDEWMLGPDVLVAPVLEAGATEREVYVPEGCFRLHGEGDAIMGPRTVPVPAPVGELPWFSRCDTSPF
ncbi:MAG TPA: TIM-barrel domain-containing protein [Polyangiaceae bacterium]|nr:TIM-barrel domain-containing protein [Polyangiaceae bacterium]